MLAAHRIGTVGKFASVIEAYADVAGISNYSLGQYKPNLRANLRNRYYQGVVTFMSRYFAEQSREYRVAKYEIGEASVDQNKDVIVASKVSCFRPNLQCRWKLKWNRRDIQVPMQSFRLLLTYLQRARLVHLIHFQAQG